MDSRFQPCRHRGGGPVAERYGSGAHRRPSRVPAARNRQGAHRGGRTTKEIATILNVSVKAVEFHRYNIRKKLRLTGNKSSLSAYLSQLFDH